MLEKQIKDNKVDEFPIDVHLRAFITGTQIPLENSSVRINSMMSHSTRIAQQANEG